MGGKKVQVAPYHDSRGRLVAQKVRFPGKDFTVTGDLKSAGLFGQKLCRDGGKMLVITEGEVDAMSACQALGLGWPAVSVPSGAGGAYKALAEHIEWLEGYEKIVLAFDNDEEGQKATDKCVELFSPGKVALADFGSRKDANEFVQAGEERALRDLIWSAKVWRPDGVVNMADVKDRVSKPLHMGIAYPWAGLNTMLYGFRPQEIVTWTAGTGVGKSALVSEVVYHLLKEDVTTGIIYLEEGLDRAGKRIVGLEMNKPIHLPEADYTLEEFEAAWAATLGRRTLMAYDHFGSLDEDVLMNRIRYMVKGAGCQVVVLDHISMVVSGQDLDTDERRMLDHVMTSLRSLTQETGASIHVVSHLRRPPGQGTHEEGRQVSLSHLRGTQAIAQLSDAVIAAERNQQADDEDERNTTTLRVLKNRYSGLTGKACQLRYDHKTGRLLDIFDEEEKTNDEDF
jgi:twinkle protein